MTGTLALQEQFKILWQIQALDLQAGEGGPSAEREALARQIPLSLLSRYDRIRSARKGVGIASPRGSRCSVCNIALPAQLYNEVIRIDRLRDCPSCLRILAPQPSGE